MDWTYNEEVVTELAIGVWGFIYELTLSTGEKYIGKVNAFKKQTLPALKSGDIRPGATRVGKNKNGKRIYVDVLYKENDWKSYTSSSDLIDSTLIVARRIIEYAPTKRSLTYLEIKHQFLNNVLEDDTYLNKNINNMFFKGKLL